MARERDVAGQRNVGAVGALAYAARDAVLRQCTGTHYARMLDVPP